ncbi:FecCD family ABC transporter permease [Catenulispora pinisilvae]|uniref:FecCD family ABC transporter permease n=1 Tax=Catenulispora pinisilvae TaxID=2705253 RepID=UPI00189158AE|nr:iron ABC transporter permease [Catenulispora pinisilvae]
MTAGRNQTADAEGTGSAVGTESTASTVGTESTSAERIADTVAATRPSAIGPAPHPARRRPPTRIIILTTGLSAALATLILLACGLGAFHIAPADVVGSLAHRAHLGGHRLNPVAESVLWDVRMPRVALAVLVGACLGCAGALMQGVFGNPLADPGVIGVSSGGAVGAVAVIVSGVQVLGQWTASAAAFVGGLVTVFAVYLLSRSGGRTEVLTLVLTGIAVNALGGALIGVLLFLADPVAVNEVAFWQLGSLSQATWPQVGAVLPFAAVGLLAAPRFAGRLDLLALGEGPARHLGVDVERLRLVLITLVAVLTAAAVAVSGIIGFVGLAVPHLLRMAAGPGHRFLIPGSALGGAVVLVAADLAARTVAAPAELPLGVLTALLGSPVFFWLLRRSRAARGGWA